MYISASYGTLAGLKNKEPEKASAGWLVEVRDSLTVLGQIVNCW
jgi:hypothetical protein